MDELHMRFVFSLLLLTFLNPGTFGAWQDGLPINSHLSKEILNGRMRGKFENYEEDHLSLLAWNEENLLIGARDALFNLTSSQLRINSVLNWTASQDDKENCQIKGQKDADCHNFVRLFHGPFQFGDKISKSATNISANATVAVEEKNGTDDWIVCGTNAFKPRCRIYDQNLGNFREEISGIAYSPFDPTHMSTSLLHHGAIYAATVADFGGSDSLIYKNPMRTEQYDSRHLSSPSFVSSMTHGDLALFFFRELAVEHTNCGKVVYSRVGRICRHDNGSRKHKDRFTTFLKARLNCSVPGEFPFYFDHIQGTTSIFVDNERNIEMLYAVFTTPENSIGASAICAFRMDDIVKVFDGPFKGQSTYDSNWLPVAPSDVPSPRPGACPTETSAPPEALTEAFHKEHPLMDETVQGSLTLVHASNTDRFRVVEVDPSLIDSNYHILYVGTETGKVLKVIVDNDSNSSRHRRHGADDSNSSPLDRSDSSHLDSSDSSLLGFSLNLSLISASWQVSDKAIKTLRLLHPTSLLVGTETSVVVLPTSHCDEYKSCRSCIQLRDPHCFWDMDNETCVTVRDQSEMGFGDFNLRQDIHYGDAQFCPQEPTTATSEEVSSMEPSEGVEELQMDSSSKGTECCACAGVTVSTLDVGNNRIPELDGYFRYAPTQNDGDWTRNEISTPEIVDTSSKYPLPRRESGSTSSSRSAEESISRGSIAIATVGSAFIALLIGFAVGFLGSRWLANKKNLSKTAATNAQFAASLTEQSQRLTPAKPIDFVVNNVNNWSGAVKNAPTAKNNLATDTLEKTVKKIYL